MRNTVDDIEARNVLLVQQIDGLRFALAENGDQHVCARDFFFSRRLNMKNGALQYALKAERRLRIAVLVLR